MTGIRSFIAVELPPEMHTTLENVMRGLQNRRIGGVRWVAPANIHITLKFLGDVLPAQMNPLQQALSEAVSHCGAFELACRDLGAFPNINRPRVIWAGIQAPPDLASLANSVDTLTRPLGFPGEDRPFSPHLTLGRVQPTADPAAVRSITAALQEIKIGLIGAVQVDHVTLFKSDLRPTGPVYSVINRFPFPAK